MKKPKQPEWCIVEKKNPLALHGLFGQKKEVAENFLKKEIPEYCRLGYFMDKTLKPEDFEMVYK